MVENWRDRVSQQIEEEWRTIPGITSTYEVSNFGRVRSWSDRTQGRILKTRIHKWTKYPQVHLYVKSGQRAWCYVHVLVTKAFPEEES